MVTAFILTGLMYISLVALIHYKNQEKDAPILIYKTLTSLFFIAIAIASGAYAGFDTYAILMIVGFVLCAIGDVLILDKQNTPRFITAIGSFLSGHVLFAAAFCTLFAFHWMDIVLAVGILAIAFYVYKIQKFNLGKFLIPVAGYALVITIMLVKAFSSLHSVYPVLFKLAITIGASMFFASDIILVFLVFKKFDKKWSAINLILYYTGQALLALSLLII